MNILDGYNRTVSRPPAFTGATSNTRGDKDGTNVSFKLFEVLGDVKVIVFGVCTTDLAGATGTLEVGLLGNTALLLPQVTATTIAAGDHWVDNSVGEVGGFVATSLPTGAIITNGTDIVETSGTADLTAGNIYYVCLWIPITPNGQVKSLYPQAT